MVMVCKLEEASDGMWLSGAESGVVFVCLVTCIIAVCDLILN